jgi:hydrogenase small subunit
MATIADGKEMLTIGEQLNKSGIPRRDFLEFCTKLMIAAPIGLAITKQAWAGEVADELAKVRRPSVVWLEFQDCTGCTETLLRTSRPSVDELIFNVISLDYHETLMPGAGKQAEQALYAAVDGKDGKFFLVCEGSIQTKDNGDFLKIAGRRGTDVLQEIGGKAAAIIAIGSCASWGGIPSSGDNPTGAVGVSELVRGVPIVNIPGCPPNPYTLIGTLLEIMRTGAPPQLDADLRPKFAYDRVIHEQCPRRAHFDSGRFAQVFGDEGHRQGWCLYKLGCKGPDTHASCSVRQFNEVPDVWPIGIGAPCVGCTEKSVAFKVPIFDRASVYNYAPPNTYPGINTSHGRPASIASGVAGLFVGAGIGAAWTAAQRFKSSQEAMEEHPASPPKQMLPVDNEKPSDKSGGKEGDTGAGA